MSPPDEYIWMPEDAPIGWLHGGRPGQVSAGTRLHGGRPGQVVSWYQATRWSPWSGGQLVPGYTVVALVRWSAGTRLHGGRPGQVVSWHQ